MLGCNVWFHNQNILMQKPLQREQNYEIKSFYTPIFFLHQNLAQILNYELRLVL